MEKRPGRGGRWCSNGIASRKKSPSQGRKKPFASGFSLHSLRDPGHCLPPTTAEARARAERGSGNAAGEGCPILRGGGREINRGHIRAVGTGGESESSTDGAHGSATSVRRNSMDPFLPSLLEEGVQRIFCYGSTESGDCADVEVTGQSSPLSVNEHVATPIFVEPSIGEFSPGSSGSLRAEGSLGSRGRKKKRPAPKTGRTLWDPEEDELLVSAWFNVSQDPIVGKDQSYDSYWGRITKYYNRNRKPGMKERTMTSAVSHWQVLSADGSKFAGYLNKVDSLHASGTTIEDRIAAAMKMYKEVEGKTFGFLHVWPLLSEHPKWCSFLSSKRQKTQAVTSPTGSLAGGSPHHGNVDVDSQASTESERPIGREAAKKARSQGSSSLSSGAYVKQFAELNSHKAALVDLKRKQVAVMRNREELKREQVTMMRNAEEERIININLDDHTGVTREYYRSRQLEIMQPRREWLGPQ